MEVLYNSVFLLYILLRVVRPLSLVVFNTVAKRLAQNSGNAHSHAAGPLAPKWIRTKGETFEAIQRSTLFTSMAFVNTNGGCTANALEVVRLISGGVCGSLPLARRTER